MLMLNQLVISFVYCLLVGSITLAATVTIGYKWRRYELVRRAIGIGTVVGIALPFILWAELNGWQAWALIVAGFIVAGGIRAVREIHDNDKEYRQMLERAREQTPTTRS